MKMKTALTIAGSDSGGGAGIQADIKTMMANGVYAMSAITALTAQNTTKVADIMEVTYQFRVLINIDLSDLKIFFQVKLFQNRMHSLARAAPGGKKINKNRFI